MRLQQQKVADIGTMALEKESKLEAEGENIPECRHARGRRGFWPYTAEGTAPEKPLSRWGVHDPDIVHC